MWRLPPPNALSPAALKLRAQTTINSRGRTDLDDGVERRKIPRYRLHQRRHLPEPGVGQSHPFQFYVLRPQCLYLLVDIRTAEQWQPQQSPVDPSPV